MDNTVGSLTEVQRSIITGKLLGDGTLRKKANTLLEVNHSYKQRTYVLWLYSELQEYVNTPPKLRVSGTNRFSYRFTTRSLVALNRFYDDFYLAKQYKSIPRTLVLNGLSLAVWFMDDGSKSYRTVYLNTQQFDLVDQFFLLRVLDNLGIRAALNKDKKYHRIRVATDSMNRFRELVDPYILKSMRYKLPGRPRID
jgi:hypothetical protein